MEIAKRLAASIRATDVAARIGGDEFGLILDQSSEDGARAQVTRLCDVLTAAPEHYDGHEIARSEGRRGGTGCVSTCRSRWAPSLKKKKKTQTPDNKKNHKN